MINIRDQKVVLVGGGEVAARKIKGLLQEGADLLVISPDLDSGIPKDQIHWLARKYQKGDLSDAKLVFACTNDLALNEQIMRDAHPSQLVNNTSDKHYSDFYNVAITQKNDLSVMISTNGSSPARSKAIRKQLEEILDHLEEEK
nr:bifunctional precorrin-2 dehydrogenase/sirohydrochlorin ferrochelatase [Streptococcus catagoni]